MNEAKLKIAGSDQATSLDDIPSSVLKILKGTLIAVGTRGTRGLSMSHISEASGVSRATLYRYFTDKDQVLAAVSEYISVTFEQGVRAEAALHDHPVERLRAVMRYQAEYTATQAPQRMIEVEPRFMIEFFRSHSERHIGALTDALAPSFDYFEALKGAPMDRAAVAETMVRLQLSRIILPSDEHWSRAWNDSPDFLIRWITTIAETAQKKT